MSQYALTVAIAALLLVFILYQQMRTRPLLSRQLIVIPVFLALLGLSNLQQHPPDTTAADVVLCTSMLTAIVFGIGRGLTTQVWNANGAILRKGTTFTLILWVTSIALRLVLGIAARHSGIATSVTLGEVPLFLAVTLATQNVVLWLRGQEAPVGGVEPAH